MKTYKFTPDLKYSPISFYAKPEDNPVPFFCAEASTMRWSGEKSFILRNEITGKEIQFFLSRKEYDSSQEDVLAYIFVSIKGAKFPCEFHILND